MSERQPYSRVYWRVLDDVRFDTVRHDMRHFGSWALLLVVADMAYPAPAFVPPVVPGKSLRALADAGLIELLAGGRYRVHGLDAERVRRAASARASADARWSDRSPNGMRSHSGRIARRDEDETRTRQGVNEVSESQRARAIGLVDPQEDVA